MSENGEKKVGYNFHQPCKSLFYSTNRAKHRDIQFSVIYDKEQH